MYGEDAPDGQWLAVAVSPPTTHCTGDHHRDPDFQMAAHYS
jgi:hypothetical protein